MAMSRSLFYKNTKTQIITSSEIKHSKNNKRLRTSFLAFCFSSCSQVTFNRARTRNPPPESIILIVRQLGHKFERMSRPVFANEASLCTPYKREATVLSSPLLKKVKAEQTSPKGSSAEDLNDADEDDQKEEVSGRNNSEKTTFVDLCDSADEGNVGATSYFFQDKATTHEESCKQCTGLRTLLEQAQGTITSKTKLIEALRKTIASRESVENRNAFLGELLSLLTDYESTTDEKDLQAMIRIVMNRVKHKMAKHVQV